MSVAPIIDALSRLAGSRFGPLWLGIAGVVLCSPVLGAGLGMDDYLQRALLTNPESVRYVTPESGGLFAMAGHGARAQTLYGVLTGALPWWTSPDLLLSFWKPLTGITHRLDYRLFPDSPFLMHLHSLLWYGLLVGAVALLYRRMHGMAPLAGLCGLLYAIDDAHVMGAGWIANRNGVITALFVVLTIYCHDRGRRGDDQLSAVLGWLLPLPGLLAGEAYVAVCGYLFAHALTLDRRPALERMRALTPYLAWILGWHALYVQLGHGAARSSFFLDPGREPLLFGASLFSRLSLSLGSQLALGSPELAAGMDDDMGKLLTLGHLSVLAVVTWIAAPTLRASHTARFWALGAVLSAVPLCATLASARHLLIPGIGAMGLLGILLHQGAQQSLPERTGKTARAFVYTMAGLHLLWAPLMTPVKAYGLPAKFDAVDRCGHALAKLHGLGGRHVVALNAPDRCNFFAQVVADLPPDRKPATLRTLTPGDVPVRVEAIDDHTLRLSAERSFFSLPESRMFLARERRFAVGEVLPTPLVAVTITAVDNAGLPLAIEARFQQPLTSDTFAFVVADERGLSLQAAPATPVTLPIVRQPIP